MNRRLYNRIMESIDREIKTVINEQFNISKMNLNNTEKPTAKMNIFNKTFIDTESENIYDKILRNEKIGRRELKYLRDKIGVCPVKQPGDLRKIVEYYAAKKDYRAETLNWLDVSAVKDMTKLFYGIKQEFSDDFISKWDVSGVETMDQMFRYSGFNSDISDWCVSNVKDMSSMFSSSQFNGDISRWDVSNV